MSMPTSFNPPISTPPTDLCTFCKYRPGAISITLKSSASVERSCGICTLSTSLGRRNCTNRDDALPIAPQVHTITPKLMSKFMSSVLRPPPPQPDQITPQLSLQQTFATSFIELRESLMSRAAKVTLKRKKKGDKKVNELLESKKGGYAMDEEDDDDDDFLGEALGGGFERNSKRKSSSSSSSSSSTPSIKKNKTNPALKSNTQPPPDNFNPYTRRKTAPVQMWNVIKSSSSFTTTATKSPEKTGQSWSEIQASFTSQSTTNCKICHAKNSVYPSDDGLKSGHNMTSGKIDTWGRKDDLTFKMVGCRECGGVWQIEE